MRLIEEQPTAEAVPESPGAAGDIKRAIRQKQKELADRIEQAKKVEKNLRTIDSCYVNGRIQEMKAFKTWLDELVPPEEPRQLPDAFKEHIKGRFERTE